MNAVTYLWYRAGELKQGLEDRLSSSEKPKKKETGRFNTWKKREKELGSIRNGYQLRGDSYSIAEYKAHLHMIVTAISEATGADKDIIEPTLDVMMDHYHFTRHFDISHSRKMAVRMMNLIADATTEQKGYTDFEKHDVTSEGSLRKLGCVIGFSLLFVPTCYIVYGLTDSKAATIAAGAVSGIIGDKIGSYVSPKIFSRFKTSEMHNLKVRGDQLYNEFTKDYHQREAWHMVVNSLKQS